MVKVNKNIWRKV